MTESRFQRWSRLKREAAKGSEPAVPEAESVSPPEVDELAENEALSDAEVLAKYNLPDPDAIELGTDIKGFLKKEIPEALRRKALRNLWRSNPVLAVLDGLNDYDEDFSHAATAMKGYQTIYKVGEGMVDRSKKKLEQALLEEEKSSAESSLEAVVPPSEAVQAGRVQAVIDAETPDEPEESMADVTEPESDDAAQDPDFVESDDATQQGSVKRYRPRMQFKAS